MHTSFLNSPTFGRVPCNGMIVTRQKGAIVFDTPAGDTASAELIDWINNTLHDTIKAVIPTHFHEDCVGGLQEFKKHNIPSYASNKTIRLAKARNVQVPVHGFEKALFIKLGDKKVHASFWGEGHTRDNVVGYVPGDEVLFGGCLIKALGAGKGNLEDANVKEWPATVQKLKKHYPGVKIVIPGHGEAGGKALLDYTIRLFEGK